MINCYDCVHCDSCFYCDKIKSNVWGWSAGNCNFYKTNICIAAPHVETSFCLPQNIDWQLDLKVKKLHKDAILPSYATDGSAGLDLYCSCWMPSLLWDSFDICFNTVDCFGVLYPTQRKIRYKCLINTGIAIEIPKGYVGEIKSKSGLYKEYAITAFNGIIDSDYRGELIVGLSSNIPIEFKSGSKIAQLIIYPLPRCNVKEVEELSDTTRGSGGFGSTGV